jgi:hypothetical protein
MDRELLIARLSGRAPTLTPTLPSIARIVAMYVGDLRAIARLARIIEHNDEVAAREFASQIIAPDAQWFPIIAAWNLGEHADAIPNVDIKRAILAGDYAVLDVRSTHAIEEAAIAVCSRAVWSNIARDIDIVVTCAEISARLRVQLAACCAILATDPRASHTTHCECRNTYTINASTTTRDLSCMIVCREIARMSAMAPGYARALVNVARARLHDVSLDEEEEMIATIAARDYPLRTHAPTAPYSGADVLAQLRNDTWIARTVPFSVWQRADDVEVARAMLAIDVIARECGVPRANGRACVGDDGYVAFDALHIGDVCDAQACIAGIADERARINIVSVCVWRHIMAIETSGSASANVLVSRDGAFIYSCAEFPRMKSARGSAHVIAHRNIIEEYAHTSTRDAICERARAWLARLEELARIEGIAARCARTRGEMRALPLSYLRGCVDRARTLRETWDARADACRFERVAAVI